MAGLKLPVCSFNLIVATNDNSSISLQGCYFQLPSRRRISLLHFSVHDLAASEVFKCLVSRFSSTHRFAFQDAVQAPAVPLDHRPLQEDLRTQPAERHTPQHVTHQLTEKTLFRKTLFTDLNHLLVPWERRQNCTETFLVPFVLIERFLQE